MSVLGLTSTQADCLAFITQAMKENNVAPSYDEIKDHLGLTSKSGVFRILNELEARGRITRLRGQRRSIGLVEHCPHCGGQL